MRDSNEGMIEIIGASKVAASTYACEAVIKVADDFLKVRFGTDEQAYMLLKKLLSFRPFENTSFGKYRYYFTGGYQKDDQYGKSYMSIRVEQNSRHKSFNKIFKSESTQALTANLLWLQQITEKEQVALLLFP